MDFIIVLSFMHITFIEFLQGGVYLLIFFLPSQFTSFPSSPSLCPSLRPPFSPSFSFFIFPVHWRPYISVSNASIFFVGLMGGWNIISWFFSSLPGHVAALPVFCYGCCFSETLFILASLSWFSEFGFPDSALRAICHSFPIVLSLEPG